MDGMTSIPSLPSTWASRELPILAATLRQLDSGAYWVNSIQLGRELGFNDAEMRAGLGALESASPPYVEVENLASAHSRITAVSERARRELGTWPSAEGIVNDLVAALEIAANAESEPERQSRLLGAVKVLGGMARDIAVGVVTAKLGTL